MMILDIGLLYLGQPVDRCNNIEIKLRILVQ